VGSGRRVFDVITREQCAARDAADQLAALRSEFRLDQSVVYLDGNSLGPVCERSSTRVKETIDREWAVGLVTSWNAAGWMATPTRLGDRIARLIGAHPGEVLVADSLTISLAKLIGGALDQRGDRHVVLTDDANFRSDIYIVEAMARRAGRPVIVRAIDRDTLDDQLNDDVALVMLTHVDYRTGEMLDMRGITTKVHAAGALMLWDLAHSAGAVPVDLTDADVDFAAGCTYKYLNAGPGAPGFVYVRTTWLGHVRPYEFELAYEPAPGMQAFVTSSPPIIAMAALDGALDVWDRATMSQVRVKSLELTDLFIELVQERLSGVFDIVTPLEHDKRASQVSLRHVDGYAIVQALIERGVVGDFRAPDICRFGFTPLYLRYVDVYDAVGRMVEVMTSELYRDPRFAVRNAVT